MTREDVARSVLAAVGRGDIPAGGPSEAAALELLDQLPSGYWRRWTEAAAQRIRADVREIEAKG